MSGKKKATVKEAPGKKATPISKWCRDVRVLGDFYADGEPASAKVQLNNLLSLLEIQEDKLYKAITVLITYTMRLDVPIGQDDITPLLQELAARVTDFGKAAVMVRADLNPIMEKIRERFSRDK